MSLINDALKRAKEAQQQAASATAPKCNSGRVEPRSTCAGKTGLARARHVGRFCAPSLSYLSGSGPKGNRVTEPREARRLRRRLFRWARRSRCYESRLL